MQIILVVGLILAGVIAVLVYLRMQDRKADSTLQNRNRTLTEPDLDFSTLPADSAMENHRPHHLARSENSSPPESDFATLVEEPETASEPDRPFVGKPPFTSKNTTNPSAEDEPDSTAEARATSTVDEADTPMAAPSPASVDEAATPAETKPSSPADDTFTVAIDDTPNYSEASTTDDVPITPVMEKNPASSWSAALQTLRQYRHNEELDQALQLCYQFLPRAQAFEQLMLTQRAIIRQRISNHQDATEQLDLIYNTAVLATLYSDTKDIPENVRMPVFAREALQRMDAEYALVGYEKLNNLKKTDITLLVRRWGEPMAHQHPSRVYDEQWWKLL